MLGTMRGLMHGVIREMTRESRTQQHEFLQPPPPPDPPPK